MCTLLPAHHKSGPHPHHPADPLHPFALPHLPFKRSSFLNLESLHLPYFSYIWKEGQEDLFPMFSHALKFSACRPSFPVRGRFHPELKSQRICVVSQQDTCSSVHCSRQWKSRNTVLFKRALVSLSY